MGMATGLCATERAAGLHPEAALMRRDRSRDSARGKYAIATSEKVIFENVTLGKETEKAILVTIKGKEVWMPLSQVHEIHREPDGKTGSIVVSAWIAKQKELG